MKLTTAELIRIALGRGWIITDDVKWKMLYLPDDTSNTWAAEWNKVFFNGDIVYYPHWLERRMSEIEERKIKR